MKSRPLLTQARPRCSHPSSGQCRPSTRLYLVTRNWSRPPIRLLGRTTIDNLTSPPSKLDTSADHHVCNLAQQLYTELCSHLPCFHSPGCCHVPDTHAMETPGDKQTEIGDYMALVETWRGSPVETWSPQLHRQKQ